MPGTEHACPHYPCRVLLRDGTRRDFVIFAPARRWVGSWGVWPHEDRAKAEVPLEDVVTVEESPSRLPAPIANGIYRSGETSMGGHTFWLRLRDGRTLRFDTGNAVDFPELPAGVTGADLVSTSARGVKGRDVPSLPSRAYAWCLYRDDSGPRLPPDGSEGRRSVDGPGSSRA
jgi:hypothetical protein